MSNLPLPPLNLTAALRNFRNGRPVMNGNNQFQQMPRARPMEVDDDDDDPTQFVGQLPQYGAQSQSDSPPLAQPQYSQPAPPAPPSQPPQAAAGLGQQAPAAQQSGQSQQHGPSNASSHRRQPPQAQQSAPAAGGPQPSDPSADAAASALEKDYIEAYIEEMKEQMAAMREENDVLIQSMTDLRQEMTDTAEQVQQQRLRPGGEESMAAYSQGLNKIARAFRGEEIDAEPVATGADVADMLLGDEVKVVWEKLLVRTHAESSSRGVLGSSLSAEMSARKIEKRVADGKVDHMAAMVSLQALLDFSVGSMERLEDALRGGQQGVPARPMLRVLKLLRLFGNCANKFTNYVAENPTYGGVALTQLHTLVRKLNEGMDVDAVTASMTGSEFRAETKQLKEKLDEERSEKQANVAAATVVQTVRTSVPGQNATSYRAVQAFEPEEVVVETVAKDKCWRWERKGSCRFGATCYFDHPARAQRTGVSSAVAFRRPMRRNKAGAGAAQKPTPAKRERYGPY